MSHVPYDELPFYRMPNPLPCGCAIVGIQGINLQATHTESRDSHIRYCPTHAAAPELLAVVKEFLALRQAVIDVGGTKGPLDQQLIEKFAEMQVGVMNRAIAAIEAAEVRNA